MDSNTTRINDADRQSSDQSQQMERTMTSSHMLSRHSSDLTPTPKAMRVYDRPGSYRRQAGVAILGTVTALLISGCSTITTGTTHELGVTSNPSGADCQVSRDDKVIGAVNPTPGMVVVGKSTHDMVVNCTLPGYQVAVNVVKADFQAATLGNILIGGVVGLAVDAASGAMGKYPPSVSVALVPVEAVMPTEDSVAPAASDVPQKPNSESH